MKIKVTEHITEIEADARELRESNTLASNLSMMLSRCFRSNESHSRTMRTRRSWKMSNLDNAIKDVAYILDSLMALRNIYQTGSCNECEAAKTCEYVPKPGQMVRYNCPFYEDAGAEADPPKIDGGTVTDFTLYLCKKVQEHEPERWDAVTFIRDMAKQFIEEYGE